MKKYLLATHGNFAEGIKSSVKIIAGDYYSNQLETICAYIDEKDYSDRILDFISSVSENDQGFIFTDLYGGSVNQKVIQLITNKPKNINVISGLNLGMLLELILNSNETLSKEDMLNAIEAGRRDIDFSPQLIESKDVTEEDFFE